MTEEHGMWSIAIYNSKSGYRPQAVPTQQIAGQGSAKPEWQITEFKVLTQEQIPEEGR